MKIKDYAIKRKTDYALLIQFNWNGNEIMTWFPKSKLEEINDELEIDEEFWEKKVEEIQNPPDKNKVCLAVEDLQENEKSYKATLSAKIGNINLAPWLFIPKSLCKIICENDKHQTEIEIEEWFWEKAFEELIEFQLNFVNKDREVNEYFEKKDFKLLTSIK